MSFAKILEEEARLFILQQLAAERDHRMNSSHLRDRLADLIGINRSREWVNFQLMTLQELSAVTLLQVNDVLIAQIVERGFDHLRRRAGVVLPGVKQPED